MGYDERTRMYSGADGIVMEVESLRGIADLVLGYERSGDDRPPLEDGTPERVGILIRGIADRIGNHLGEVEVPPAQTQTEERRLKFLHLMDAVNSRCGELGGFISLLATSSPDGTREVTEMQWTSVSALGERLFANLKETLRELDDFRKAQAAG